MISKVAGCNINVQKSLAFIYTNSEQSEKVIGKTIHSKKHQKFKIPRNIFINESERPL
jgi:hypothetical protein